MFKVSQEINLGSGDISPTYGKYQRTPDDGGTFHFNEKQIFVAPELAEISKIQLFHFPEECVQRNSLIDFVIKKNDARGNIELRVMSPIGRAIVVPLQIIDPDRFGVKFLATDIGLYKILIKFNGVDLPKCPYSVVCVDDESTIGGGPPASSANARERITASFKSDAREVRSWGMGLKQISLKDKNEFTVDASKAGTNILFVGICGPNGQCDEVTIKHTGNNIYNVIYRVPDRGQYLLAVKWGDEHIPDSPLNLVAN